MPQKWMIRSYYIILICVISYYVYFLLFINKEINILKHENYFKISFSMVVLFGMTIVRTAREYYFSSSWLRILVATCAILALTIIFRSAYYNF